MMNQAQIVSPGATMQLAQFAATHSPSRDAALRVILPKLLLDNVAVMLAGTVQPVHARVSRALKTAYGDGPFTAMGGMTGPLSAIVLLDGLAAADFEFEHVMQATHPASSTFPALLALAAKLNSPGPTFLDGVMVAYELATRIGSASGTAVEHERGFHNPGLNGTVAAAAGCSRLLGLDPAACASAMGLAASSSAGLMAFLDGGAMTKRLHPARSAQLGLECALMAQAGVEGPTTVLESPHGFLEAFSPAPEPGKLCSELGSTWVSARMIIKLAPVHAYALAYVQALNEARDSGLLWSPEDITAVTVRGPSTNPRHMDVNPKTLVSAQYSIPYCVAVALARDLRNPLAMNEAALTDPSIRTLLGKITFELPPGGAGLGGGEIVIQSTSTLLKIETGRYAGLPGATDYADAIERKFDRTMAALSLDAQSAGLRKAVEEVATEHGPGLLREAMVRAGASAKPRWGSGSD